MQYYYDILDLAPTATVEQIQARYRQFLRMFDPALYTDTAEIAYVEKKRKAAEEAYQALCGHLTELTENQQQQASAITASGDHKGNVGLNSSNNGTERGSLPAQLGAVKAPLRWLHRFGLSIVTIFVAALVGSAALDQGLGVLAYVNHLRQEKVAPEARLQPAVQPLGPLVVNRQTHGWQPIYAANQQQVAFVANNANQQQVFVADPATGEVRQLAQTAGLRSLPLWSPQADKLAFWADQADSPVIWIHSLATKRAYSFQPATKLGQLQRIAWSVDGRSILFETYRENMLAEGELWQVDSTGQQVQPISRAEASAVLWSTGLR